MNDIFNCWPGNIEPTAEELERYDALEIHPVADILDDGTGDTWCEVVAPEEAQFWTVYLHLKEGGVEALSDQPTEPLARAVADQVSIKWNMLVN